MSYTIALNPSRPHTILAATTATGAAPQVYVLPQRPGGGVLGNTANVLIWSVVTTSTDQVDIKLEGSLDNVTWFTIDEYIGTGNTLRSVVDKATTFIRANVTAAGNGANTVIVEF